MLIPYTIKLYVAYDFIWQESIWHLKSDLNYFDFILRISKKKFEFMNG